MIEAQELAVMLDELPDPWRHPMCQLIEAASLDAFGAAVRESVDTGEAASEFFAGLSEAAFELYASIEGAAFDDGTPNIEYCKGAADQALDGVASPLADCLRPLVSTALDYAAGFSLLLLAKGDADLENINQRMASQLLEEAGVKSPPRPYDVSALMDRLTKEDHTPRGAGALEIQRCELLDAAVRLWATEMKQSLRPQ